MTKIILTLLILSSTIFAQDTNNQATKVILTLSVKAETKKEFMEFLDKNVPNVRSFEGCTQVKLYFDEETNEMLISENWQSKTHHGKYIEFISKNGVMQSLISFLQKEPSIKYYEALKI